MTNEQRLCFQILKSAITGEKYQLDDIQSSSAMLSFALRQQLVSLYLRGIENCLDSNSNDYFNEAFIDYEINVFELSEYQLRETLKLTDAFEKAGIDHLPFKGIYMKDIYPEKHLREMSDIDILIKEAQYSDLIKPLLHSLNYVFAGESEHELKWIKDGYFVIELHKMPIQPQYQKLNAYFGDGWKEAILISEKKHSFTYSQSYHYLYMLSHFAKHFSYSGVGVKYLLDFFVYQYSVKELDFAYIKEESKKLGLYDFLNTVLELVNYCFSDPETQKSNDKYDAIINYIFESGVYGSYSEKVGLSAVITNGLYNESPKKIRRKYLISKLFPSFASMKERFPALNRCPILLPFFWSLRLMKALFSRQRRNRTKSELNTLTDDSIQRSQTVILSAGLEKIR